MLTPLSNLRNQSEMSKSWQTFNSILSMDDTILKGIEDNIDEGMCSEGPEITDKSFKIPVSNWSTYDALQNYQSFKKEKPIDNKSKRNDVSSTMCNSTLDKTDYHWQDDTFLDEVFTQIVSDGDDGHALQDNNQVVQSLKDDTMNILTADIKDFTSSIEPQYSINNEQDFIGLGKRNSIFHKDIIPMKKLNLNQNKSNLEYVNNVNSKNDTTFYGLSNKVKELILKVRGINALYEWQDECLNLAVLKSRKNLIYALPTSGGKTLVAEILMLRELICNKKNAIFILPFVAIVQEKVQSMTPFALELGFLIEEYAGSKGYYPPKKRRKKRTIYICTIEKALGLINSLIEENRLNEIGIIVVDELHLLGENGGRGATLEGLLTKVLYINENVHIIGMSATIGNLNEISQFLNSDLYTGDFRPIEIKEYVKCENNIWLVDLKTKELLVDLKKINYRYSKNAALMDSDRIGGLVMDVVPNDSCLIFCPSRKNCENVALLLSKVLFKSLEECKIKEKEDLLNALRTEEGLCPILYKTIKFGVAYHHSGLTAEERRLLEDAFRAGTLCVLCCTSTLAAGVNLPARRVILRSPYIGNEFINISRYKQMIGRAGRAGMGNIGESILICKTNELIKIKELLTSNMDDSLSTLHTHKDRGINNLILSAILFSIAKTRDELHKIAERTLLSIQQNRLNINVKTIIDDVITEFLKRGVIKVKKTDSCYNAKPNLTIAIPSQDVEPTTSINNKQKKVIVLTKETELELCDLGRAAMKGSIEMDCAHILYKDLETAKKHLILLDYLHLLYLVTPYDVVSQIKPVGTVYYDVITSLSETQMETARLLGINEVTAHKLREGLRPKNIEPRVVERFYVTLILYELWNHHAVYSIAEKYNVSRGIIQNLLTTVASFSASVVRFCQELEEFWAFRDLLTAFSKKLSYCCPMELEALMSLPLVKIGRARQLYKAGYTTVQSIAKANPIELQEKITYLNKKVVIQIIEAAKLLLLEKWEDLKDKEEDILDGIDINNLEGSKIN